MGFDDLINLMMNPGDEGVPDTIYDDLRTSHGDEVTQATDSASAKVAELMATIEELNGEINRLKVSNWELFEQIPKAGDAEPDDNDNNNDDEEDDDPDLDDLLSEDDD